MTQDDQWGDRLGDRGSDASMEATDATDASERYHGQLDENDAMEIRKVLVDVLVDTLISVIVTFFSEGFQLIMMFFILEKDYQNI
eukprot:CAMPEP_0182530568 /NCGR_PEP_ID=MMETSP1323-20130603/6005_1 /TAXON_ID=236787 /ORGANISM="Florenciella parvula, Strain RCC1693" /LENGTH=84 /DNA_ID=CAMNT_0024739873 /DNA_START=24 /DNA_END=278 /DNA_ORIENTATION=-